MNNLLDTGPTSSCVDHAAPDNGSIKEIRWPRKGRSTALDYPRGRSSEQHEAAPAEGLHINQKC